MSGIGIGIGIVLLLLSVLRVSLISCQRSGWRTLSGEAPVVIAKGGFSGLFPDSSLLAYQLANLTNPNAILWCDVQLTKDNFGICAPNLLLDNCTDISRGPYQTQEKSYLVNGEPMTGWFSVDYDLRDLQQNVLLTQGIYSRTFRFDGGGNAINTVESVRQQLRPLGYWLNVQHDMFFAQFNLSMRRFVISVSKSVVVNYISSPEVGFLMSIVARFRRSPTKLVFRFLEMGSVEPSTNQTYRSLLRNLTFIKTFASGILVPKTYILPVNSDYYLLPHTSVVSDAHAAGLEVFASGFSNDAAFSYNFSYDPLAESLAFIDNADFSVDGLLSDFPITPSMAVGCFSNISENAPAARKPLIISHNGASGVYPGSTDEAYKKAVADGADFIDCSVQITKDKFLVCLNSIDLLDGTTVFGSPFNNRISRIPKIQSGNGIFTFNLTWLEIQQLSPLISNPYLDFRLRRNPAYANAGKFMTFPGFLTFAKSQTNTGIVVSIENAVYLAEQGFDVTDAVIKALSDAGYDNHTAPDVMIQSSNSPVLEKIKQQTRYKRLFRIDEKIRDAVNSSIQEIKSFADHVAIGKGSVYAENKAFVTFVTDVIPKLKSYGLTVYVFVFQNEFVAQAWDFYSDATVEINSFVGSAGADGIITEYPETASRYRRSPCLLGDRMPEYMRPVLPGGLLSLVEPVLLPPTQAPLPVLTDSDVEEPPLPSSSVHTPSPDGIDSRGPSSSPSQNGQPRTSSCAIFSTMAMLLASLLLII